MGEMAGSRGAGDHPRDGSGLAMLGLVVAIWFRRRAVAAPDYLEVALLMLLVPLLSPQGWDYGPLLATPAVVCLVDRWGDLSPAWRGLVAGSLAAMGLTLYDVMAPLARRPVHGALIRERVRDPGGGFAGARALEGSGVRLPDASSRLHEGFRPRGLMVARAGEATRRTPKKPA